LSHVPTSRGSNGCGASDGGGGGDGASRRLDGRERSRDAHISESRYMAPD
jgi:hypothetical protein